jgi:hypothetical protein
MFTHPKIIKGVQDSKVPDLAFKFCFGPENNLDVYVKQDKLLESMHGELGYNVFALDCRLPSSDIKLYRLLGFVIVMDMFGNVINAIPWSDLGGSEVESVSMYDTSTVLFSTPVGAFQWNYIADTVTKLPFKADTHSLVYRYSDDRYYGLFSDSAAVLTHNAQSAVSYDSKTGANAISDPLFNGWAFSLGDSHFNYLSVDGEFAYLSSRTLSALLKVDMRSNQVIWQLGGVDSSFTIIDANGNPYSETKKSELSSYPWGSQHMFKSLGDGFFSLFDNNVVSSHAQLIRPQKQWGSSSRCVVLFVDENQMIAWEVFSYALGDNSLNYGGTEVLPTGNILTNSYVDWVYPMNEDHQYHVNLWEISPESNEPIWRIGFKGINPADASDLTNPYPHYFRDSSNPDATITMGWNIYNVDRVYPSVSAKNICIARREDRTFLSFAPYNTIRTQADAPGVATVSANGKIISMLEFKFQKGWLKRTEEIEVPLPRSNGIVLAINNQWDESLRVVIDESVPDC